MVAVVGRTSLRRSGATERMRPATEEERRGMSTQVLNDETFSAQRVGLFEIDRAKPKAMTYGGVAIRALFLLAITSVMAVVGWNSVTDVRPTSGLWFFLGYLLLIALTFAAVSNPRIAPIAGLFY